MNYEKSCGAVIYTVVNGKRLYLVEIMQKGHTSFCKGHVEENESEHQTAAREIREETGLEVKFVEGFRQTIEYSPYRDCSKTVVFFLACADSTRVMVQEDEVREIEWLPFEEALEELTFDSTRDVLKQAEHFLNEDYAKYEEFLHQRYVAEELAKAKQQAADPNTQWADHESVWETLYKQYDI